MAERELVYIYDDEYCREWQAPLVRLGNRLLLLSEQCSSAQSLKDLLVPVTLIIFTKESSFSPVAYRALSVRSKSPPNKHVDSIERKRKDLAVCFLANYYLLKLEVWGPFSQSLCFDIFWSIVN